MNGSLELRKITQDIADVLDGARLSESSDDRTLSAKTLARLRVRVSGFLALWSDEMPGSTRNRLETRLVEIDRMLSALAREKQQHDA